MHAANIQDREGVALVLDRLLQALIEQRLTPLPPDDGVILSGHAEKAGSMLQARESPLAPDQTERFFDLGKLKGGRSILPVSDRTSLKRYSSKAFLSSVRY